MPSIFNIYFMQVHKQIIPLKLPSIQKCIRIPKWYFAIFLVIPSIFLIPESLNINIAEAQEETRKELSRQSFVAQALAKSGPAVVTIETKRIVSRRNERYPPGLLIDPYFERFFGLNRFPRSQSRVETSQGSGFIFDPVGLVLTNAHVIEKTEELIIGLSNGQRIPGIVIGIDRLTDLAVIRLKQSGPWPTASLGNSDQLSVGDWAIAVGNPFGLENTVTLGIISNLNRNVGQLGISGKRLDLIQTDAAINPGNSGGPLLNAEGEVIGINTLVRSGPGAGLGFAIPINRAKLIANQLVRKGKASHPVIGISLSRIKLKQNTSKNSSQEGAMIQYVVPNGPAEKSGLKVGDIILFINEIKIKNPAGVVREIDKHGTKNALRMKILREDKLIYLLIKPTEMDNLKWP